LLFLILIASILMGKLVYPQLGLTPWYWGSELIAQKRNSINKNQEAYNTLFIGSSRVYRHVDPVVVDSFTKGNLNTRSYNFGINWLFAPESFFVYDQLLHTEKMNFKYVIIELSKIRSVDYSNLHTTRTTYFYDNQNYIFSIKSILYSNFSIGEKIYLSGIHTLSYIDHVINLGYFTDAIAFSDSISHMELTTNGYEPLSGAEKINAEENIMSRHRAFLNDTSVVSKRKQISESKFRKYDEHPELLEKYNRYYADKLNTMAAEAKKQGTHLVFLLSPRIDASQYDELIPLFHYLHRAHRIEISDARKYPEFYISEYSFDETHLNARGAALYSAILARKLTQITREK